MYSDNCWEEQLSSERFRLEHILEKMIALVITGNEADLTRV